ncbi:GNAT family N-acetyltransferase [Streptomyces sp. BI20]|uniref:GNAT family N-acetyltransferase n=1 Tax=Streptomyces sp. BI20 TaxID=3403460 RepID=UPI003C7936F1
MEQQTIVVRGIRAEEWAEVKELRVSALRDPVAHLAFLETVDEALARPDSFWRERAAGGAAGVGVRQFIAAEGANGRWVGTVTVLVERAGGDGFFGEGVPVDQGHLVGVYVRPEYRGVGLTERLFRAAVDWCWEPAEPRLERVRLLVHEDNERAARFYRRYGFTATGVRCDEPGQPGKQNHEYAVARPS